MVMCAVDLQVAAVDEDRHRLAVVSVMTTWRGAIAHALSLLFSRARWQSRTPSMASSVQRSAPT